MAISGITDYSNIYVRLASGKISYKKFIKVLLH